MDEPNCSCSPKVICIFAILHCSKNKVNAFLLIFLSLVTSLESITVSAGVLSLVRFLKIRT